MTFFHFAFMFSRRTSWSLAALLGLITVLGYHTWRSRSVPVYAAVTTVQLELPAASGPDAGEAANGKALMGATRHLLLSDELRTRVVASLTPPEQALVLRRALQRTRHGKAAPTLATSLGTIDPEPVANSTRIQVRVIHEDPEAAALIANRYVEQFELLVAHNPGALGPVEPAAAVPFHRLDVALPDYSPRAQFAIHVRRGAAALILFTLGVAIAAALSLVTALRNAGEMHSA